MKRDPTTTDEAELVPVVVPVVAADPVVPVVPVVEVALAAVVHETLKEAGGVNPAGEFWQVLLAISPPNKASPAVAQEEVLKSL